MQAHRRQMKELKENIQSKRAPKGVLSPWLAGGTTKEVVAREAAQGAAILKRLQTLIEDKFQSLAEIEYDSSASERERVLAAGERKAYRDMYRLLQLDI
jgi:hypothetical protein